MSDDEKDANLPAALPTKIDFGALKKAAATLKRVTSSTKGASFLKFNTAGQWVFGQDDDRIEDGSLWGVNSPTLKAGFICWKKDGTGAPLGEEMTSIYGDEPEIVAADLPYYDDGKWEPQFTFHLMCLSGEDVGKEVVYPASNQGGRDAVEKLFAQLTTMDALDVEERVPVITLDRTTRKTKYKNNQETPVLNFERLMPNEEANAILAGDVPEPEPEPPKTRAPARRRTR